MNETAHGPTDSHRHCPECDYNLTGVLGGRCPWCGRTIDASPPNGRAPGARVHRLGAGITCAVLGLGSLLALVSLAGPTLHALSLRDGLVVIGVVVASLGHLALALLLTLGKPRWPLRHQDAGRALRFVGWLSVMLAVIGATLLLQVRVVQGFAATNVFEFILGAIFYSAPGWTLLIMTLLTFEPPSTRSSRQQSLAAFGSAASRPDIPFAVDSFRAYGEAQIAQTWSDEPRPTTPAIEAEIARTWEAELSVSQDRGGQLYNGKLVRVREIHAGESTLSLSLGPTNYRDFLGTNLCGSPPAFRAGGTFLANALGVSATVITRDGYLAFGRRSDLVAFHAGFVHTFGGMVEEVDRHHDGHFELFECIKREVCEELGLRPEQLRDVRHVGFVRDLALQQPEMLFDVAITLDRTEIESLFTPQLSQGEHTAIEFLPDEPDAVRRFLEQTEPIAPVAEGALLLHGRHTWGATWFDRICALRYRDAPQTDPSPGTPDPRRA